MPNFKPYVQNQSMLFPADIRDLIPEDHLVRVIDKVVEGLDLRSIYDKVENDSGGCTAYHPMMLLKVLFYAYIQNIRSSRKIAEKLRTDIHFMYLAGMQKPDFRTISDFRKNNIEELEVLFTQIVVLCMRLGLAKVGHVAIDGTKMRASAGKKNTRSEEYIDELMKKVEEQMKEILENANKVDDEEDELYGKDKRGDEIPKELTNKKVFKEKLQKALEELKKKELKQVNTTDPEARFMKAADGGIQVSYNVQVAIDAENQIIVANNVCSDSNDEHQFIPMYENIQEVTGKKPEEVSADAGYEDNENYIYIKENSINAYLPDRMMKKEVDHQGKQHIPPFDRRNFIYNENDDTYRCPAGETLYYYRQFERNGVSYKLYKCKNCGQCSLKRRCTKTQTNRQIVVSEADAVKEQMREKLLTEHGSKKYLLRLSTVEPVIGNLKRNFGFTYFLLRGLKKTMGEFNLMCIAHNIKKIHRLVSLDDLINAISSLKKIPANSVFLSKSTYKFLCVIKSFFFLLRYPPKRVFALKFAPWLN